MAQHSRSDDSLIFDDFGLMMVLRVDMSSYMVSILLAQEQGSILVNECQFVIAPSEIVVNHRSLMVHHAYEWCKQLQKA